MRSPIWLKPTKKKQETFVVDKHANNNDNRIRQSVNWQIFKMHNACMRTSGAHFSSTGWITSRNEIGYKTFEITIIEIFQSVQLQSLSRESRRNNRRNNLEVSSQRDAFISFSFSNKTKQNICKFSLMWIRCNIMNNVNQIWIQF